ncbi:MAG: SsrA-binding protein SmpB [Chloroflexi bacterium]|nr:SsrA-binding protein SmpB [Chloroflexota bacterium]
MPKTAVPEQRATLAQNRRARFEYDVLEELEAGIALAGSEIKSMRQGHTNIAEGYARFRDGELWLYNVHVAPYLPARENHEPTRPRRLLLHRKELDRWERELREQPRTTIVPLRVYLRDGRAKVALGLVRGRRQYDKRQAIASREAQRSMQRALRHAQR